MEQAPLKKAPHLYEIDMLRFIAAILVVVGHYVYAFDKLFHLVPSPYPFREAVKYVYPVIEIFFMISGYIVFRSAVSKTVQQFIVSRVVRIYPVYWVCCTVFFLGLYLAGGSVESFKPSISNYLLNMTMMHEFFGRPAINPAFWTLTYELSFYFIILLIIALRLWNNILLVLSLWLAYTFLVGPLASNNAFAYLLIPKYSPCFIAGILFALIQKKAAASWKLYLLMGLTFIASMRSANAVRHINEAVIQGSLNPYIVFGITASFYVLMFLIVFRKVDFSKYKKLAYLGVLAYPLYLIHNLGAGIYMFLGHSVNKYVLLFGTIALMLVISLLIHLLAERRFARFVGELLTKFFARFSKGEVEIVAKPQQL